MESFDVPSLGKRRLWQAGRDEFSREFRVVIQKFICFLCTHIDIVFIMVNSKVFPMEIVK